MKGMLFIGSDERAASLALLQQLGGERCAAVAQTTPANVAVIYAVLDALPVYEAYATNVPMLVLDNAESLEATG